MTGSMRLLQILHGLGHTACTATVYRHDTALSLLSSDEEGREITIREWYHRAKFRNQAVTCGEKTINKSIRTIKAPETHMTSYTTKERGTLSLSNVSFDEEDYRQTQHLGRKVLAGLDWIEHEYPSADAERFYNRLFTDH